MAFIRLQTISLTLLILGGARVVSAIIGGSIADPTRYPYFARVNITRSDPAVKSGGGTLIAPDVVLTSAARYEYERTVRFWLLHPDYDDVTVDNDVALLFLDVPVMDVPLVKLNRNMEIPETGQSFTELGFGVTSDIPEKYPENLMEVAVDTVPFDECQIASSPPPVVEGHVFCAGITSSSVSERHGHCWGDYGGPLLDLSKGGSHHADKDVQVGVISYATIETSLIGTDKEQCQTAGYPGGFTKVATYTDWIESSVRTYSKYSKGKRSKKSHTDSRKDNDNRSKSGKKGKTRH
ncbi:serine-type endopeptidase [Fragilaria crotonensis]|nr:serine-type endopeptidase [Fragilaria crotonensis]